MPGLIVTENFKEEQLVVRSYSWDVFILISLGLGGNNLDVDQYVESQTQDSRMLYCV